MLFHNSLDCKLRLHTHTRTQQLVKTLQAAAGHPADWRRSHTTWAVPHIHSFLILSLLVTLKEKLSIFNSSTSNSRSCLCVSATACIPHRALTATSVTHHPWHLPPSHSCMFLISTDFQSSLLQNIPPPQGLTPYTHFEHLHSLCHPVHNHRLRGQPWCNPRSTQNRSHISLPLLTSSSFL